VGAARDAAVHRTTAGGAGDRLVRLAQILRALRGRVLLGRGLGLVAECGVHREVVRADVLETSERDQPEVVGVEHVVQRVTEAGPACVEGAVEATAFSRVDEAADLLEEACGARPGDVVQVTAHDDRHARLAHPPPDQQQLGVALQRLVALAGHRWTRVDAVEPHQRAVSQADVRLDRGDVGLHQVVDLGILERQPGVEHHAVRVRQRTAHDVAVRRHERIELLLPPVVRLQAEHEVGVAVVHGGEQTRGIAIGLQDVGDDE
jgi:hypothetical protein